jgi:uroporphyrin-III C-methyltransferase
VERKAKVYLVGGGPGDPDLLTRKAARILAEADCVIYDRLISAEVLALANPAAHFVYAGKEQGQQDEIQAAIFEAFLALGGRAGVIVRLKSGDPMVFGRGGEELEFLHEHGFEVEVVPGVSSAIAAPGLAGIPLTYRGLAASFTVVAGHRQSISTVEWPLHGASGTLVVLMGVEHRDIIGMSLMERGWPAEMPAAFIEHASTAQERVVETTLGEMARGRVEVSAPAVLVIGEVVAHRSKLENRAAQAGRRLVEAGA